MRSPASNGRSTDVILYFVIAGRVAPVARPADGVVSVLADRLEPLPLRITGKSRDFR